MAFPDEYRTFIAAHVAFLGNGFELYGLSLGQDGEIHFFLQRHSVNKTIDDVPEHGRRWGYIAISSDGMGVGFPIDTNARKGLRVVADGIGFEVIEVANSLEEFCKNMLTDTFATLLTEAVASWAA